MNIKDQSKHSTSYILESKKTYIRQTTPHQEATSLTDNSAIVPDVIKNPLNQSRNNTITSEDDASIRQINSFRHPKVEKYKKFRTLLLLSILFFCGFTTMLLKASALQHKDVQAGIAEDIIRFHVIANSDSNEDQTLKLAVKDTLVKWLSPLLRDVNSKTEARAIITKELDAIKSLAEITLQKRGYYYPVTVSLENTYFPLKIYGDFTFPPGYYEALRVQIGRAEGKNWWCVMFPPLCFVDETYSIVDESSGEKLKTLLTEEEYNTIINKKTPIKVKFKLLEAVKDLFQ